jgi:subtilisin family serine protease
MVVMRRLIVIVVVLALVLAFLPSSVVAKTIGGGRALNAHAKDLLAQAIAEGRSTVEVIVASKAGGGDNAAAALGRLGANIRSKDNQIGYVLAIIDTSKVIAAADLADVEALDLDELIPIEPPANDGTGTDFSATPPGPTTPAENPYMPTRDIGAPQFVAAHPTYDGRGVTIGILDTGIDVFTPELQTAKTIDGTSTRKIVDWVNKNDPLSGLDPSWVNMATQVSVAGGSFATGGKTYTGVAADGAYRFGTLSESDISGSSEYGISCGADLNRNGVCNETFGVLWRVSDNVVWVDTNGDRSFAGASPMTDYKVNHDVGLFGTDNPSTATRETVPFTIQTNGKDKFVNIGVVGAEHGTHVAGIAAGKGFFGGAYNGAAPEAQIVSVRVCVFGNSCTAAGLIEGMIWAAKQANVDVINMSIGGLPALNDGNNARAALYNRLIEQSNVQMFISAGNSGPGLNTVGDPSVATLVMSVGASVNKDTWLVNYGANAVKTDGMFTFSSRGPREDGGLKPDIVAPGAAISTVPAWEPNFPLVGPLPPGYDLLNGTSMAAPEATGGAALLISAAKQTGAQYQPEQLRKAIKSTARYNTAYRADEQGDGLFQVGAAWDLLKTNIKLVDITSSAPVNTVLSSALATPNRGHGIYEREGWTAPQTGTRTITFTRTSGGSKPITYNLSWLGNDGTFSTASTIVLADNAPTNLNVAVNVTTNGAHSAILRLDDPATAGVEYEVLNTIVAAEQFNLANNFSVTRSGQADRPDYATFFFLVPANTPALKVDLTATNGGRIRLFRVDPRGIPIDPTAGFQTGGTQTRTQANPLPGVWETTVDVSRTSPVAQPTFTITATILGVDITPASWTVDPTTIGTTYTQAFSFTNRFGSFTGGAVGTALTSAFRARPTIAAAGPQQTFTVNVPAGSTLVSARIGNAADSRADLDLFLFDCHLGMNACVLKSQSTSSSSEEFVSSANPVAGTWLVLVDPFAVPAGSTAYDFIDNIANAAFGSVTISDPAAVHANGATWSATASATAAVAPEAGRFLQGFVRVMSGTTVLGSAEVDLLNVGP